jgi:hypothetical protein
MSLLADLTRPGSTPIFRGDGFNRSLQHTMYILLKQRIMVYAEIECDGPRRFSGGLSPGLVSRRACKRQTKRIVDCGQAFFDVRDLLRFVLLRLAALFDPDQICLEGSVFVLTGPMSMGPRSFIVSEIESAGGFCGSSTTKKTDYVVISSTASRHWRTTHFGTKIEKARKLIEEGQKLRFLSEITLEKAILRAKP